MHDSQSGGIKMAENTYRPDYVVPPGWILEERLEAHGISHAGFARRCGRSPKLISEIIAGTAPVAPETALQFEKVLGMDASVWLGIEADYQLRKAREVAAREAEPAIAWYKRFPVKELVKRGYIERPANDVDGVGKVLAFFGVASVDAWQGQFGAANVAYRHSPSFESSEEALATWLRLEAHHPGRRQGRLGHGGRPDAGSHAGTRCGRRPRSQRGAVW